MRKEGLKRSPTVSVMVELATDSRGIVEDKKDTCLPNSCAGKLGRLTGKERKKPHVQCEYFDENEQ